MLAAKKRQDVEDTAKLQEYEEKRRAEREREEEELQMLKAKQEQRKAEREKEGLNLLYILFTNLLQSKKWRNSANKPNKDNVKKKNNVKLEWKKIEGNGIHN